MKIFQKNIIYIFWYFFKTINYINFKICHFINTYLIYDNLNNINFIKDSKIIKNYKYINIDNIDFKYDYVLTKNKYKDKYLINILINFNKGNLFNELPTDYQFLLVIVNVQNENFNITNILKDKNNYYYTINTLLFNKEFMNWLFFYHLKKSYSSYKIKIMDNNANLINLTENNYIILNKNNYTIFENN